MTFRLSIYHTAVGQGLTVEVFGLNGQLVYKRSGPMDVIQDCAESLALHGYAEVF